MVAVGRSELVGRRGGGGGGRMEVEGKASLCSYKASSFIGKIIFYYIQPFSN